MKTSTVYAVQAVAENYGRAVVRLFADADAAEALRTQYEEYAATRPVFDDTEEADAFDNAAYMAYCEACTAWLLAAPKGFEECDEFIVTPMELEAT